MKVRKKEKGDPKQQTEDPKRQKVELKGPRVKHVCRSASIVLGQPIATFPTQEEKERQDKPPMEDESSLPSVAETATSTQEVPSSEIEMDNENKAPVSLHEVPVAKDIDVEMQVEPKKRKVDVPVPVKLPSKLETSEDETVMDLVPRKTTMKSLTNITNVCNPSLAVF